MRLSEAVPLPFVRVDLLETDRGPVVGELTPYPGWAHRIGTELDRELGERYEASERVMLRAAFDWRRLLGDDRLRPFVAPDEFGASA